MRRETLVPVFVLLLSLANQSVNAQSRGSSNLNDIERTNPDTRITQALDERQLVTIKGNVHPLARPEFDQGAVRDTQPLRRMLLLLQRSTDQEAALEKLLEQQQDKSSADYHSWITPDQFGKEFGPADGDIQTVTNHKSPPHWHQLSSGRCP